MAKTIEQLKAQSAEVKNATVVGENTATRVGTLFTDIVEHVEQYEAGLTEDTKANAQAIEAEKNRAEAAEQAIIYDVSSHNDGAVFESLSVLLSSSNLSTLIPASVRHGGMTIRFIQGSEQSADNKYVQYRLMSDTFNTASANWQGVDDQPTYGSNNLVKSGGVYERFSNLELYKTDAEIIGNIFNKDIMADVVSGFFVGKGDLAPDSNCAVSSKIKIKPDTIYTYYNTGSGSCYAILIDKNGNTLTPLTTSGSVSSKNYLEPSETFKTPSLTSYILVTTTFLGVSYKDDISIYEGLNRGYLPYDKKLVYSQLPDELWNDLEYKANLEEVSISKNLFDKTKIEQGWIEINGGEIIHEDGQGYKVSSLIEVEPNTIYFITFASNLSSKTLRFLDKDYNPLKGINPLNGSILDWRLGYSRAVKSPIGSKYVQFQVLFNYTGNEDETQFEKGSVQTPHEEFISKKLLKEDELPLSVQELINDDPQIVENNKLILNVEVGQLSTIISPFNSTHNLKMTFYLNQHNRNRLFNWEDYFLVNKSTEEEIRAKYADDDICPELIGDGGGYIGANHGAQGYIELTCNGHDKTVVDIGSIWSNGTNNFTIIGVDTNKLYLIGENKTQYPNWNLALPITTADTFTHVNGATHTTSFTSSDRRIDQWMPICKTLNRKLFLDDKEISQSGIYQFEQIKIVESYNILNPASVLSVIQQRVGTFTQNPLPIDLVDSADIAISHQIVYTFKSAVENFISTNTTFYQHLSLDRFGFTQCIELPYGDNFGTLKLYIPKAKSKNNGADAVDFRTIVNASEGAGQIEYNDFENPLLPPDRQLQFNNEIGIQVGYLFDYGVGGNNRADALVNHAAIYQSPSGMKMYPNGISGWKISEDFKTFSAVCFKIFLDRNKINTNGVIAKTVFEYENRLYIYGDFNASGIYEIIIPEKYIGHKVNIFEMRENVRLLNEIATDRIRIKVNDAAVMYGYFVGWIDYIPLTN